VNYRHAFHAGNFADVVKHAVLARVLHYLRQKPAAFRVIDTHAGAGLYDLAGSEASRSGEWHEGIEKLLAVSVPAPIGALLAPYLDVVATFHERGRLAVYPGSPAIVHAWLRPQDRLIACELEPRTADALARNLHGDPRIKTQIIDGWIALTSYVPPKERRGLVLVDPPFEDERDFPRLARGLAAAHRKWATGIFMLWYPIKGRSAPDVLARQLRRLGIGKVLRAELTVAPLDDPTRLNGCGLILVNPPWTLEGELAVLLPALAKRLGRAGRGDSSGGGFRLDWLAGERPATSR